MVLGAVEIHDDTSLQKSQLWRPETIRETHKGALIEWETLANQEKEDRVGLGAMREALKLMEACKGSKVE